MLEAIKLKRKEKIVFRQEEDAGILFNPENGRINLLNSTAKFIWLLLDGTYTRHEIIKEILAKFKVEDEKRIEQDFDSFLRVLSEQGFLETELPPKVSALTNVCFGITSRCNFSCKHCLNRGIPAYQDDLTTEELLKVIDQMKEIGVKSLSLFGGEPLLQPDFKKIVEYINKAGISISLNTNATLVDRPMAKWLKAHKINGAVVSFDGSSSKVMDRIRGEGAFINCLKGISALVTEGLSVLLSVTLNKINYQDIRNMVLLGKKIGASSIRFNHVFFGGNATCYLKEIYLSPKEEKQAIEAVWQAKEEFGDFINPSSSYLCQKKKLEEVHKHKPVEDKIIVYPCGAASNKCAIRPDGWVVPCEIIWEVKAGNLREKSLKEIWYNSEVMQAFRKPLEINLDEIPECKGCLYQYLCFHGHRCYPYYYPGGIKNRALYCWLNKEKEE